MRDLADETHIQEFMRALGRAAGIEGRVYLTGGATAVLYGWRTSTIDVDIKVIPDRDEVAKAERGHEQDLLDVKEMIASGLVDPAEARAQFEQIEPELYRFPAIDPASFRKAVEALFG